MGTAETVGTIEKLFQTYPFAKECVLVFLSVILGAICTAAINNGAIRRKCRFDMQYELLKEESKNVAEFQKALERVEISLSFINRRTVDFQDDIELVSSMAMKTNERLREQRKFVRKYLSATLVEESAQIISDYNKIMYRQGTGGIVDFHIIDEADSNTLNRLRRLTRDVQKLNDGITESLEKLIAPNLFAKIKRKFRKLVMFVENCYAIWVVHRKRDKRK